MSFDLTNKNISDTFQNLLQQTGSSNEVYDLEGNQVNHINITNVADAKEILIQTDDANTSYIMVGSSAGTTVAHSTIANRKGLKLNAGETLVLAIASFATVFIHAETSNQYVNVAYFK